jgi:hypothetical protein
MSLFATCPACSGSGLIDTVSHNSRTDDPQTAVKAGQRHSGDVRRFSAKSRQAKLLRALVSEPMTAQEAALRVLEPNAPISAVESCRRRVSDLKQAGFVMDSGQRRHNHGSPDESVVWKATLGGVFALEWLQETGWSV